MEKSGAESEREWADGEGGSRGPGEVKERGKNERIDCERKFNGKIVLII